MLDKFIQHKNCKIRFRDQGKGKVVVLLHGFLENLEMWDDFAAELTKNFRVVRVDLLGHGHSDNFGYIHTMDTMADFVDTVLKSLQIDQYTVVGHSMGGYVALAMARNKPTNILGLGLFHSTSYADSDEKKSSRGQAIALVKDNHTRFVRLAIPNLFRPKNRSLFRDLVNKTKDQALLTSKQGIIAALEGMRVREDLSRFWQEAQFQKYMLIGRFDRALSFEDLVNQNRNSNVWLRVLDVGHMGHIESRDQSLESLREWLLKI